LFLSGFASPSELDYSKYLRATALNSAVFHKYCFNNLGGIFANACSDTEIMAPTLAHAPKINSQESTATR
jgi:hypothetical protein